MGYSCLQVWPQPGERTWKEHLEELKKGRQTRIIKNTLRLASLYGSSFWKVLFQKQSSISNHFLITDLFHFSKQGEKHLQELKKQGFKRLKIKMHFSSLKESTSLLKALFFSGTSSFLLRLDFNHSLNEKILETWLKENQSWLLGILDFIEDPFFYNEKKWSNLSKIFGVSFALDRGHEERKSRREEREEGKRDTLPPSLGEGVNVFVIKPTLENPEDLLKTLSQNRGGQPSFVFTHNMDPLLGQLLALMEAERHKKTLKERLLDCGLLSGNFFKGFPFLLEGEGQTKDRIQLQRTHEHKVESHLKKKNWEFLVKIPH